MLIYGLQNMYTIKLQYIYLETILFNIQYDHGAQFHLK